MSRAEVVVACACGRSTRELATLLSRLPASYPLPIVAIAREHADEPAGAPWVDLFGQHWPMPIRFLEDKDPIRPGRVHVAPTGYDLYLESKLAVLAIPTSDDTTTPSFDATLESAVDVYGAAVMALFFGHAHLHGAAGIAAIEQEGGLVQTEIDEPTDALLSLLRDVATPRDRDPKARR